MIHTAFLTDYNNRIYTLPATHNQLKLFLGLCPGSEIFTAVYENEPEDFRSNWYNYKFKNSARQFIKLEHDDVFFESAIKITKFLDLWKDIIGKLNFIYERESSPFRFENTIDPELITTLTQCKYRCEKIIIDNYQSNNVEQARFLLARETFNNILL